MNYKTNNPKKSEKSVYATDLESIVKVCNEIIVRAEDLNDGEIIEKSKKYAENKQKNDTKYLSLVMLESKYLVEYAKALSNGDTKYHNDKKSVAKSYPSNTNINITPK